MLDNNDIKKLIEAQKEVFVTKQEFENFIEIIATKNDLKGEFAKTFEVLKKMDDKLDDVGNLKHRVDYIENVLNIQPVKK